MLSFLMEISLVAYPVSGTGLDRIILKKQIRIMFAFIISNLWRIFSKRPIATYHIYTMVILLLRTGKIFHFWKGKSGYELFISS